MIWKDYVTNENLKTRYYTIFKTEQQLFWISLKNLNPQKYFKRRPSDFLVLIKISDEEKISVKNVCLKQAKKN